MEFNEKVFFELKDKKAAGTITPEEYAIWEEMKELNPPGTKERWREYRREKGGGGGFGVPMIGVLGAPFVIALVGTAIYGVLKWSVNDKRWKYLKPALGVGLVLALATQFRKKKQ